MMLKKLALITALIMAALTLGACTGGAEPADTPLASESTGNAQSVSGQDESSQEESESAPPSSTAAEKTGDVAEYYNGYAGLTVMIPEGWYVTERNETNLTEDRRDSADPLYFDRYDYGDDGYRIRLVHMQNKRMTGSEDHCELILYMEEYPAFESFEEYLDYTEGFITMDSDNYVFTFKGGEKVDIDGRQFERLMVEVTYPGNDSSYMEEYYITPISQEDGVYLVAYINYWTDSQQSKDDAYFILENSFALGQRTAPNRT